MPIHNYVCKDCNEKFDLYIGFGSNSEELVCKKCGSKNIQRAFSSFGVSQSSHSSSGGNENSCPTGNCPFS